MNHILILLFLSLPTLSNENDQMIDKTKLLEKQGFISQNEARDKLIELYMDKDEQTAPKNDLSSIHRNVASILSKD